MSADTLTLMVKMLSGTPLTAEEQKEYVEHTTKYNIVRLRVLEHYKNSGKPLDDFHFSTGPKFSEATVEDIVSELINSMENVGSPLDFGDFSLRRSISVD